MLLSWSFSLSVRCIWADFGVYMRYLEPSINWKLSFFLKRMVGVVCILATRKWLLWTKNLLGVVFNWKTTVMDGKRTICECWKCHQNVCEERGIGKWASTICRLTKLDICLVLCLFCCLAWLGHVKLCFVCDLQMFCVCWRVISSFTCFVAGQSEWKLLPRRKCFLTIGIFFTVMRENGAV